VVNDLTYEKLGEILAANPDGVLSVRDEMRGLFMSLSREESAPARAFYLQAWSGGSYTFDRIGRGTVTVADARLSIIGGIQPGPLSDLVQQARRGAADDGMIERFLIAWPDAPGEWREVDRWPDSEGKRRAWETFERLDALAADALGAERESDMHDKPRGLPFLRFDDEAREAFGEWRSEFERTIRAAEGEGLEGALSKFRHHVPALALALHVIDGGTGPVTLPATLRALTLAEYFESHARRLHSSGRRMTVRAARTIIDKARAAALPDAFSARDVYRNQWAGLSDRAAVADALDLLAAHGWLVEATIETGGRPTATYSLTEGARRG
jgi:putative DNA primase/helicase